MTNDSQNFEAGTDTTGNPGDIEAQLATLVASGQDTQTALDGLTNAVTRLRATWAVTPMRIANTTDRSAGALRGPNLQLLVAPNPTTREELLSFTGEECIASANALNLSALPADATVIQRRRQIAEYLGVVGE